MPSGLCQAAQPVYRCVVTEPARLFADRDEFADYVPIGLILQTDFGPLMRNAAQLAIRLVNEQGGLVDRDGRQRKLGLVTCTNSEGLEDGLDVPTATREVARYLVDNIGVSAILGTATSDTTKILYEETRDDRVLIISPGATAIDLTALDTTQLLWRTPPPDDLQALAIAGDMRPPNLGAGRATAVDRVAIIAIDGPYGEGLSERFAREFERNGGQITGIYGYEYGKGGTLAEAITRAPVTGDPQEILFVSNVLDDVVSFLDVAAQNPNYDGKRLFLTDGATDAVSVANPLRLADVRGTRPRLGSDSIAFELYVSSYVQEFNDPDIRYKEYAPESYDAAWLSIYATAWALQQESVMNGDALANGLRQLSTKAARPVVIGTPDLPAVIGEFMAGRPVNIEGASGSLDFDPVTEEPTAPIEVWDVDLSGTPQARGLYYVSP